MKAVLIHSFQGIEKIEFSDISVPIPQADEVQIAVKYAGVNPVDWKIAEGFLKTRMDYQFPIILGWDVSGIISAVGKNVKHLKIGDPVFAYCRKESIQDGAFADYICLNAESVALKPKSLSFAEASCIPLSALTAWQALYDIAHLKARESVLIQGGSGGVGSFAIQFAKLAGAHVITTTRSHNFDYVTLLGADESIDYTKENVVERLKKKPVDVLLDAVGGESLDASYELVKKGGRLVTIAGIVDQMIATQRHLTAEYLFVSPNREELDKIAHLLDTGKLKLPRIQELPFEECETALRKVREGHTQGKIVLKVND